MQITWFSYRTPARTPARRNGKPTRLGRVETIAYDYEYRRWLSMNKKGREDQH